MQRRHVSLEVENDEDHASDDDQAFHLARTSETEVPTLEQESAEGSGEDEEDDVDENLENESVTNAQTTNPQDQKRSGKPKKPPTGEELRNIKDATELYRSSSFKLQVRYSLQCREKSLLTLN